MRRNWGLPAKTARGAVHDAREIKPILTLVVSGLFGVIGAAIAAASFAEARDVIAGLFRGASLAGAVIAAGFGCWAYVWLARPRFAAQLSGGGQAFSDLLRFYAKAAVILIIVFGIGLALSLTGSSALTAIALCLAGGAGAAAAFQTVLAFVPYYEDTNSRE